jgi:hypothetical protein
MSQFNNLNNSDVNTLISYFTSLSGFQRSNRFKVNITPPAFLNLTPVSLFASSVQIPTQIVNYYQDNVSPSGAPIDVPVKREYDSSFRIEFILDSNWDARAFFDNWMDKIFYKSNFTSTGYNGSLRVEYWSRLIGTVDIYALDVNNNTNRRITLYDAWPSTILPTQMMNDAPNDYLTLVVDMNYRYYRTFDS